MKWRQIISEYRLCGRSRTLPPRILRREYRSLLWQADEERPDQGVPLSMKFMGRQLRCFHRPSVVSLFREIFIYQHYNPPIPLGDEPIVVDAGANIGLYCIYAGLTLPGVRIYAFEADPITFACLQENVKTYMPSSCQLCHMALSDKEGTTRIIVDRNNPNRCTNTIMPEFLQAEAREELAVDVPMGRLSDRLRELPRVDFLKMDVEGAEFAVFEDLASSGTLDKVRSFALEVHRRAFEPSEPHASSHRLSTFFRELEDAGFVVDFFARAERPFGFQRLDDTFMLRGFRR